MHLVNTQKYLKDLHFLTTDTHTDFRVSEGKKY